MSPITSSRLIRLQYGLVTSLQTLAMGDPTAENEMTTLGNYYLPTDQYGRTLQGAVNLVVGRKGSGKTALFIQARDKVRADKRNIVVDLKPEGYQLIKLKEDILTHLSEGSRQHLHYSILGISSIARGGL